MTNAQRIAEAAAILGRPGDEFHTYQGWRARGFQVQRGERALLSVPLWIPRGRRQADAEDPDTDGNGRIGFILKKSHLFGPEQVKPIEGTGTGAA